MARLLHQNQQAELTLGSGEWLLAVIGAIAAKPPDCPELKQPLPERRDALERQLLESGLAYGTGAHDQAIVLRPGGGAGSARVRTLRRRAGAALPPRRGAVARAVVRSRRPARGGWRPRPP